MSFSDRLKQARKHGHFHSQADLAASIGVSQGAISKIERGETAYSEFVFDLAKACNVNPAWLATGEGEMAPTSTYQSRMSEAVAKIGGAARTAKLLSAQLNKTVWPSAIHNLINGLSGRKKAATYSQYTPYVAKLSGYRLEYLATGHGEKYDGECIEKPPTHRTAYIQQVRLGRLQQLMAEHYHGNIAALSRALDKSPAQIRAILNPEKTGGRWIGERQARAVEQTLSLPAYWLDASSENDPHPAATQEAIEAESLKVSDFDAITAITARLRALQNTRRIGQTLMIIEGVLSMAEQVEHLDLRQVSPISS